MIPAIVLFAVTYVLMLTFSKFRTNPVPFIIGIAVSSNLQGAATLVGDTTAIMLGSALDMIFVDFFWYKGKPSMFFAVELGAILSAFILAFIFRKEKAPIPQTGDRTVVTDYLPSVLLVGTIILLICASFAPDSWNLPSEINGLICCALLVIGLIYNFIRKKNLSSIIDPLKDIDFESLGLLVGLFIMIGGVINEGVFRVQEDDKYVYACIKDKFGKWAVTRGYAIRELI